MKTKYSRTTSIWHSIHPITLNKFVTIASLLILFTTVGYSACHAATHRHDAADIRPQTVSLFVEGIVTRSAEMVYISEQDSEVFAFYRNTPVKVINDVVFLQLLRRPAQTQIFRESWSGFFAARTRNDPTGRWRNLQEYLEENMSNLTVFRLPREAPHGAQYDLYAVGIFNGHTVVGVQMYGVAT